jgi:hypothetical protein
MFILSRISKAMQRDPQLPEARTRAFMFAEASAAAVLQELADTAAAIDRELVAIERFIDTAQQRAALSAVKPQVNDVIATTYSARQTILRTAVEDRTRRIAALKDSVAAQAAALENYQRNGDGLSL